MATKRLTELDFEGIKNNLKLYLQDQEQFQDYDFEASGLSVLIDLLAYNTHYNAVLAHMTANEAFLDSAVKRSSVASIAKTMGYTARSARAARATVNLTVVPDPAYSSSSFSLTRESLFTTLLNGKKISFYPETDYVVNKTLLADGTEVFAFTNVVLVEGTIVKNSELVELTSVQGPVLMANPDVDTTTIRCRIQKSLTDTSIVTYNFSDSVIDVSSTSEIFFIEEALNGFYQVVFGDGTIGKALEVGNVVRLDYIATNASLGNGAKVFTPPSGLTGVGSTVSLTVVSPSSGGAPQESVDSIRFSAPRFNATKNRAVTANDYKSLILQNNPNVKSVAVWGGEYNDPPIYGKVFVSLQPKEGLVITEDDKSNILRDYIEPRQPVSILTEFIDPEYTYIGMDVTVDYDSKRTTSTSGEIESSVRTIINNFFNNTLNSLESTFYYSKLSSEIVTANKSVIGTNLSLRLQKRVTPTFNRSLKYTFDFNNKVNPYALFSNFFNVTINGKVYKVVMADVPNSTVIPPLYSGTGKIILKTSAGGEIVNSNAGTIDYDTGKVVLTDLNVQSLLNASSTLNVTVTPHESAKDIRTEFLVSSTELSSTGAAVLAKPSKNIILNLDTTTSNIPNNIFAGITVSAKPKVIDS